MQRGGVIKDKLTIKAIDATILQLEAYVAAEDAGDAPSAAGTKAPALAQTHRSPLRRLRLRRRANEGAPCLKYASKAERFEIDIRRRIIVGCLDGPPKGGAQYRPSLPFLRLSAGMMARTTGETGWALAFLLLF